VRAVAEGATGSRQLHMQVDTEAGSRDGTTPTMRSERSTLTRPPATRYAPTMVSSECVTPVTRLRPTKARDLSHSAGRAKRTSMIYLEIRLSVLARPR